MWRIGKRILFLFLLLNFLLTMILLISRIISGVKFNKTAREESSPKIQYYSRSEDSGAERVLQSLKLIDTLEQSTTTKASKNYKLAVGVSVAKRNPPTVYHLLEDLFSEEVPSDTVILVHVAFDASCDEEILRFLYDYKERYGVEVIVERYPYPQAQAENIKDTRGDSMERTIWRTKQVLDYSTILQALLKYNATYNLVLEDDVTPATHVLKKVKYFAEDIRKWGLLTLYSSMRRTWSTTMATDTRNRYVWGACAWLYHISVVEAVVDMLLEKPWYWPVDLLVPTFVYKKLKKAIYERTPNLFQHISEHSTYRGKDAEQRHSESWRSPTFERDEDNNTVALIPSKVNGYIGCFQDSTSTRMRDLIGSFDSSDKHGSINECKKFCKDFFYFGLQLGFQCYCGNEFGLYGQLPESKCNYTCQIQKNEICGGQSVNSVYRVTPYDATYLGCYKQDIIPHFGSNVKSTSHVKECTNFCLNIGFSHVAIGLKGGNCYCVSREKAKEVKDGNLQRFSVASSECNLRCHTNRGQVCGGLNSFAVYKIL